MRGIRFTAIALLTALIASGPFPGPVSNAIGGNSRASAIGAEFGSEESRSIQTAPGLRYWIDINPPSGGPGSQPPWFYTNPIGVSGDFSATDYAGQQCQYHVQIDWGDGVIDADASHDMETSSDNKRFLWQLDFFAEAFLRSEWQLHYLRHPLSPKIRRS